MSAERKLERGAALVEFAVVVPVMLALLLVVFDFGRGFHAYLSVSNGARHAARVAMQDDKSCTQDDLAAFAQNGASPYDVALSGPVEYNGLCYVIVDYQYTPIVPFITTEITLPGLDSIGPLWDGSLSELAVSKVDGKTVATASATASADPSECPHLDTEWEWVCWV